MTATAVPEVQLVPLKGLEPSPFQHRSAFDDARFKELVASVKEKGVLQPILVRPVNAHHEIVFGHRRVEAAKKAGLDQVPAMVRELDDRAALEAQIIENAQREDVHPLDEAEGYRTLHEKHGLSADEIAAKTGKSKSHIYARIKLCALSEKAKKLCLAGKFGAEVALLIARIPKPEDQDTAAEHIADGGFYGDDEPMSYRDAAEYIRENYTLDLAGAPFDTKDAELYPEAGPCTTCPKRSGANPELFPDMEKKANVCADAACFAEKKKRAWATAAEAARAKGLVTISRAVARTDWNGQQVLKEGFVRPSDKIEGDRKKRTYAQVLGDAGRTLAKDGRGKPIQVVDLKAAKDALKKAGITPPPKPRERMPDWQRQQALERERKPAEQEVLEEIVPLYVAYLEKKKVDPLELARELLARSIDRDFYRLTRRGWKTKSAAEAFIKKATASQLAALAWENEHPCFEYTGEPGPVLLEAARALKVNVVKLRDEKLKELRAAAEKAKDGQDAAPEDPEVDDAGDDEAGDGDEA